MFLFHVCVSGFFCCYYIFAILATIVTGIRLQKKKWFTWSPVENKLKELQKETMAVSPSEVKLHHYSLLLAANLVSLVSWAEMIDQDDDQYLYSVMIGFVCLAILLTITCVRRIVWKMWA